jgi:hypothetical protein
MVMRVVGMVRGDKVKRVIPSIMHRNTREIEERRSGLVPLRREVMNERSATRRHEARIGIFKKNLMDCKYSWGG